VAGFGPVDGPLARQLLTAAAVHPASRFCLTLTGEDGQAIGHGCLPGFRAWSKLTTQGLTVSITPLARGSCDHRLQEPGYQPSRKLQHLIQARTPTCSAPGCQRAAVRCDLDHTKPYDQGGRTCECDLAPLCRHHHRCKQAQGWRLEQPSPGIMRWSTPAGRRYTTDLDSYP
ncbi:MAG TPA: HNH endonuclease signature motif containing protein, partial [Streptosporangiaceae bacterium]|nr:HNH endonuclease signature motif containing protein [Streptosporangiaceae bacterium]